jgi:hypothetical protein
MPKRDTHVDQLARLTYEQVHAIRDEMATKKDLEPMATRTDLKDMEDRLVTHLTTIKADVKQVIADEAANTVEIARLKERMSRLEKRVGITK